MVAELLFSVKFGVRILPKPAVLYVICWLVVIMLVSVGSVTMLIRTNVMENFWRWNVYKMRAGLSRLDPTTSTADSGNDNNTTRTPTAQLKRRKYHHVRKRTLTAAKST